MDIKTARKHLNEEDNKKYSDQEIQEIVDSLSVLADIALDQWFRMSPEERAKYSSKNHDSLHKRDL